MIIGVLGFAGSGKGTVADILVGKGFKKESFADPVKDAVAAIFGWPRFLLEGDTPESRLFRETVDEFWSLKFGYPVKPRYMLQLMGTEAGRDVFNKDVWIHSLMNRASKNENTVIADVRFPNEIDAIKEAGGFLVRVKRGPEPEWFGTAMEDNHSDNIDLGKMSIYYPQVHISEWAWIGNPNIEYLISNEGTLDDLERETEKYLQYCIACDRMLD